MIVERIVISDGINVEAGDDEGMNLRQHDDDGSERVWISRHSLKEINDIAKLLGWEDSDAPA